ncbi:site-specific integrase, partial [Streptomyces sp. 24-1644]|uniref:site-specific integrase n=1 Tax=Streptomyces sp. 24-1644 TaxID=3457315 RepID=UPI003FA7ADF3
MSDRSPRSIPDRLWDELFTAMNCDRDRALLEIFVSSGARAKELLGITVGDNDWSGQRIHVITKSTRAREAVPIPPQGLFRLALYIMRHTDIQTTSRYLAVHIEELFDELTEHYASPRPAQHYPRATPQRTSRRCSVPDLARPTTGVSRRHTHTGDEPAFASRFASSQIETRPASATNQRDRDALHTEGIEDTTGRDGIARQVSHSRHPADT